MPSRTTACIFVNSSSAAAFGVDRLAGCAGELAEFDDLAVLDPDIAAECWHPRAVDDAAVADQNVVRHRCPSSSGRAGCCYLLSQTITCWWQGAAEMCAARPCTGREARRLRPTDASLYLFVPGHSHLNQNHVQSVNGRAKPAVNER